MELNLSKLSEQQVESTTNQRKMKLSADASTMVFQLFTKNVYSNPIGTIVREITSNCDDSHTEAGVSNPILIRKSKDKQTDSHYISFIDFGVGMSEDRVYNIYGTYFESTKRVDNSQIGGFGIGGKTPLAYKRSTGIGEAEYDNSFFIITTFDKVKSYYCVAEGSDAPVISKLHEEPTEEQNGTEIRVPVLEKDIETFAKEMVRQLYYFENVIFEGFEETYQDTTISNAYSIVQGKSFLYRGTEYDGQMHVALGKVAYPIDFSALGLDRYKYSLPIALKLNVGDIIVTVSREQLDYSESTIKLLKKKLEEAKTEVTELLSKQYEDIKTLEQYFNVKTDFGKLNFKNGMSLYVGELVKQKDIDFSNFTYSFMKMPNDKQLFRLFFEVKSYGKKPSRSRWDSAYKFEGGYQMLSDRNNLLSFEDEFKRKIVKQSYLKSQFDLYHIIGLRNLTNTWMKEKICNMFNVNLDVLVDDKGIATTFVQSLIEMQEEFWSIVRSKTTDYDSIDVPQDFIEDRKRERLSTSVLKTTIPVNFVGGYSRQRVKIEELVKTRLPIFYGDTDDENKLWEAEKLFGLLFNSRVINSTDYSGRLNYNSKKSGIIFLRVAKNNIKYMAHCPTAYHVSEFQVRMLNRKEANVRKYFEINDMVEKFDNIDGIYSSPECLSLISPVWGAKVQAIKDYIETIPEAAKNDSIRYQKSLLEKYFDLSDVNIDAETKKIIKSIEKVEALIEKNDKTLNYLHLPYRHEVENYNPELIKILKKVMSF